MCRPTATYKLYVSVYVSRTYNTHLGTVKCLRAPHLFGLILEKSTVVLGWCGGGTAVRLPRPTSHARESAYLCWRLARLTGVLEDQLFKRLPTRFRARPPARHSGSFHSDHCGALSCRQMPQEEKLCLPRAIPSGHRCYRRGPSTLSVGTPGAHHTGGLRYHGCTPPTWTVTSGNCCPPVHLSLAQYPSLPHLPLAE